MLLNSFFFSFKKLLRSANYSNRCLWFVSDTDPVPHKTTEAYKQPFNEQIIPLFFVFLWQTCLSALVPCVNTLLCMLDC